MTNRILPSRWGQAVVDLDHDGFLYRVAVSRFADGSPAEFLIDSAKPGSRLDTYGRDVAVLLSLLVQRGVDLLAIEHALDRNSDAGLAGRVVRLIGGAA